MEAKETLRSMYDHRKQMWKIVKKTAVGAGGWRRYGAHWYYTKPDADAKIKALCTTYPNQYQEG
jgi:hypothetical protein